MVRERSKILREECLRRVGGDVTQRRQAHISEAPREHGDAVSLDELRRGDGRLHRRLVSRCVDRLLAIREEQHDLSRARAATIGEELPRGFEAVGDRGLAVRRHVVDARVNHGRVVRPWHARRRIRREGHHREARRVLSEEDRTGRLSVGSREEAFISVLSRRGGPAPWRRPSARPSSRWEGALSSSSSHRVPERSQSAWRREAWARAAPVAEEPATEVPTVAAGTATSAAGSAATRVATAVAASAAASVSLASPVPTGSLLAAAGLATAAVVAVARVVETVVGVAAAARVVGTVAGLAAAATVEAEVAETAAA
eukprot:scaffold63707_cov49-Phaeocystis_antarctica.AAC.2